MIKATLSHREPFSQVVVSVPNFEHDTIMYHWHGIIKMQANNMRKGKDTTTFENKLENTRYGI